MTPEANYISDHVDKLIDLAETPKLKEITILTGSNGGGKSFIRKIVGYKIAEREFGDKTKQIASSTSMQQRTASNPEWGGLSAIMRDSDWTPTSTETIHKIKGLLGVVDGKEDRPRYLIIDEPEIGMGEETVLALAEFLNKEFKRIGKMKNFLGALVITHSRLLVENLNHNSFLNIEGLSRDQWLTRKIVPFDLEELHERSLLIHSEIQKRINAKS